MNASLNIESMMLGVMASSVPFAVAFFMQRRASVSAAIALSDKAEGLKQQLEETVARHSLDLEEARRELSVVAYPFERTEGDDGWVIDDRLAEVGYKYQLFVKGIPCFSPHEVIVKRVQKKEVNQQKLSDLRNDVESLLTAVANQHPAFSFKKILPKSK